MSRYTSILLCLVLLLGNQEASAKIKYGIEEAIDDIGSFIPGAKFVLTTAVKLWSLYGEVRELVQPNASRIDDKLAQLEAKLDEIALEIQELSGKIDVVAEDVKDIKNLINDKVIMELPKEINLNAKRDYLYQSLIFKVSSMYELFLQYTDTSIVYEKEDYLNFAQAVVDPHIDQLKSILNQIKDLFVETSAGFNILNLLANKHLSNTLVCSKEESPLHQITVLYRDAMMTETKSFLMFQFAYEIKAKLNGGTNTFKSELEFAEQTFFKRTVQIVQKVKKAMLLAHADYFTCNLPLLIEGDTYGKIGPIFQRYLIKEKDFEDGIQRGVHWMEWAMKKCGGSCQSRTNGTEVCLSKHCERNEKKCPGRVVDCESFQPDLFVCLADKTSERRYEYLEAEDGKDKGKIFGHRKTCIANRVRFLKEKVKLSDKFSTCEYCLCTCLVDNEDKNIIRFFSLHDVTADVQENKVVTGVKIVKRGIIFHIKIQHGLLERNGNINQASLRWKDVEDFDISQAKDGIDYHTVTWDERSVYLDDLKSESNSILTGLRFQKAKDGIKLEIQITPFDFKSGELEVDKSTWVLNPDDTPRTELFLENRALPSALKYQYLNSADKQFFKFTTSSVKDDVGQTVVPYIDLQPVETAVSVPLAGAGLIHKSNNDDSAGFLAFKLFTYNYAPHLED